MLSERINGLRLCMVLAVVGATAACDGTSPGNSGGTPNGCGHGEAECDFAFHVVDVGSGLGVFVEGPDFTLVYDAGSDDDNTTDGQPNRFVDYLKAVRPGLTRIDHVILSHPHQDHVNLLPDVVDQYEIGTVWDSGASSGLCAYQNFLVAIGQGAEDIELRSAARDTGIHDIELPQPCHDQEPAVTAEPNLLPSVQLRHGPRIRSGLSVELGAHARMKFLYAHGETENDPNLNSLVVRLDVLGKRFLLPGDANDLIADPDQPSAPPNVESQLLELPADELKADLLVAGFHGLTGDASGFIRAVAPLISVVPSYPIVIEPFESTLTALAAEGEVFRTDEHDATCPTEHNKIGSINDGKPGGCSNVKVTLEGGELVARYFPPPTRPTNAIERGSDAVAFPGRSRETGKDLVPTAKVVNGDL